MVHPDAADSATDVSTDPPTDAPVDPVAERGFVDWPDEVMAGSVEELAALLACEVDDLEDWVYGALAEDPGHLEVAVDPGSFTILALAGRVVMWSLWFPFSAREFNAYLIECDDRTTIATCLSSIPTEEEWRNAGQPSILPELADLCAADEVEFAAALGHSWEPLDLDWGGELSNPHVYLLWNGHHIVGIDDCNLHVWSPVESVPDGEEPAYGDPDGYADIWDEPALWGGPTLGSFVRMLAPYLQEQAGAGSPPTPIPPSVLEQIAARAGERRVRGRGREAT